MCPYYHESQHYCKIYNTTQNSSNDANYCHECRYSYTECPNFKQLSQSYGGNPPPPYKF